ncbi:BamA/TamA family outer membrane protein [Thalassoroseus pseudoceratinae]|uniref:hypothetical protein n=1 Tax=Thalassoroseus pseudoceratinae TaxID=2713176 RepID=UPI0014230CDC|nr:hypothetical protein [Thalassoroseus pseudoceratinae]
MNGWRLFSLCFVIFSLSRSALVAELVGNLGELERIRFEGLKTFTAEQLRDALANDFDYLLAAAADVERTEFALVLSGRLIDGYKQAGFTKPEVDVNFCKDHVQVHITEGPRYRAGAVTVRGPESVDGAALTEFVENPSNESAFAKQARYLAAQIEKKAVPADEIQSDLKKWNRDEWANFHLDPEKHLHETIATGLKAQGFFYPEFECRLVLVEDKANLEITITNEGPTAVVKTVTFHGVEHHSPDQIRKFLGIETGERISQTRLDAWREKLLDSYCFLEARLYVLPSIAKELPCELVVEVIEQPRGPYLGEELTEIDQAMLRHSMWWQNWHQSDDDLVYQAEKSKAADDVGQKGVFESTLRETVIASSQNGILLDVESQSRDEGRRLRWTLILEEDRWEMISWHSRNRVRLQSPGNIRLSLGLRYKWDEENQCWMHSLQGGCGIHSHRMPNFVGVNDEFGEPAPDQWFDFQYPASHAIAAGRDEEDNPHREGDEVVYGSPENPARMDFATGRPMGFHAFNRKAPVGAKPNVTIVPGEFQRRLQSIRQETQEFTSGSQTTPLSTWVGFLFEELVLVSDTSAATQKNRVSETSQNRALILCLRNLSRHNAFSGLETLSQEVWKQNDEQAEFTLPSPTDGSEIRLPGLNEMLFGMAKPISRGVFQISNALFDQDTAPGRVGWNVALFCTGRFAEAGQNLSQLLQADDCGPLTCLYVSELFALVKSPQAIEFAKAGVSRLDTESLRRELKPVLSKDAMFLKVCDPIFTALQEFTPEEIEELLAAIKSDKQREQCRTLFARIQAVPKDRPREQLIESIVLAWESGLRELVETRLKSHLPKPAEFMQVDFEEYSFDKLMPQFKDGSNIQFVDPSKGTNSLLPMDDPLIEPSL